jgi:hypothetical protein
MSLKLQTVVTSKQDVVPDEYTIRVEVTKMGDDSFDDINRIVVGVFTAFGIDQDKIIRVSTSTKNMEIVYKCEADRYKDRLLLAKGINAALKDKYVEVTIRESLGLSEEKYNTEYHEMQKKILEQTRKGLGDLAGEKKILFETVRFENVQPYTARAYLAEESAAMSPQSDVVSDKQTFTVQIRLEYEAQYQ